MKPFSLIVPFIALGLVIGLQDVNAQKPHNADLHPPYLAEEAMAAEHIREEGMEEELLELNEGEELREGEEGEIIERGLRRFHFKKKRPSLKKVRPKKKARTKTKPRVKIPKRPKPGKKKFRLKRKRFVPPVGDREQPELQDPIVETPPPPLTERELIHERIDVHAQRSLLRISKTPRVLEARLLFEAVKSGALGGIYKADTGVPALRAVRMGTLWFKLIPQGQNAVCLTQPTKPGEKPILVFRKSLVEPKTNMAAMDAALLRYPGLCQFGVLRATVREGGHPVSGADVDVRSVGLGVNTENCRTPNSGRCRFSLPQNNSYDVTVVYKGKEQSKRVTLLHNQPEAQVEFNFGPGKGTIPPGVGGLVVTALSRGKPVAGAEVRIIGAEGHQHAFYKKTGGTGLASFAPPAGEYTVFVTKDGFEFAFYKVKVREGVTSPVILHLTVIPIR